MSADETGSELLFERFKLVKRIGSSWLADVYEAEQVRSVEVRTPPRPVIVKQIKRGLTSNPVFVDFFTKAARTAEALNHRNIVRTIEFGYVRDAFYVVQDYVAGLKLASLLKVYSVTDNSLGPSLSSYVVADICKALEFAHGQRDESGDPAPALHLNISPRTVMLTIDGTAKLADFGLAIPLATARASVELEDTESISYLSPEQASGRHDINVRSDLYSLGLVLYELLAGRPAINIEGTSEGIERSQDISIEPIDSVTPDVPPTLKRLVNRLLSPNPQERPKSASEVRSELDAFLGSVWVPVSSQTLADVVSTSLNVDLGHMEVKGLIEVPTRRAQLEGVTTPGVLSSIDDDDEDNDPEETAVELPSYPVRREEPIKCSSWDAFKRMYRQSISVRAMEIDMANPPEIGTLLELVFELPDSTAISIPGEVFKVRPHPSRFDVRLVNVAMELSDETEARVLATVDLAEGSSGARRSLVLLPSPDSMLTDKVDEPRYRPLRRDVTIRRPSPILGIDFGTSYSCAAVIEDGNVFAVADEDGRVAIPSFVLFRGKGDYIVGKEAVEQASTSPEFAVGSIKRLLARRIDDRVIASLLKTFSFKRRPGNNTIEIVIADQVMQPHEIAAIVLRHLLDLAEEQLGKPIGKIVLAYPPLFDGLQIAALQKAAKLAGVEVVALIPEPLAVALAHNPLGARDGVLGVLDFGAGSVTFSVLNMVQEAHSLAGCAAESSLGGDELTFALASIAAESFRRARGVDIRQNSTRWQKVVLESEKAKWRLSQDMEVTVALPEAGTTHDDPAAQFSVTLNPEQFSQLAKGFIDRSLSICLKGLHAANVGRRSLSEVLVTGGMMRLPGIQAAAKELFVFEPLMVSAPELSVAIGAAVQGAKLEGLEIRPRPSRHAQVKEEQSDRTSWLVGRSCDHVIDKESEVAGLQPSIDIAIDEDAVVEEVLSQGLPSQPPPKSEVPELQESQYLGTYELLAEIGRGSIGEVHLSRVAELDGSQRPIALKVLHENHSKDAAFVEKYVEAVRRASRLQHPNIVQISEYGQVGGSTFVVMECLSGQPLSSALERLVDPRREVIDPCMACYVAIQVSEGLHYAHELTDVDGSPLEFVHTDVSPNNIFLTYTGSIKLLDFGVTQAKSTSDTPDPTTVRKYSYLSPEHIKQAPIDRRSDVFSLGIILWEMLSGRSLFETPTVAETMGKLLAEPIQRLTKLRPEIPQAVDDVVAKALRRDPEQRYQTIWEFHEALLEAAQLLGSPSSPKDLADALARTFAEEQRQWTEFINGALRAQPSKPPAPDTASLPHLLPVEEDEEEDAETNVYMKDRLTAQGIPIVSPIVPPSPSIEVESQLGIEDPTEQNPAEHPLTQTGERPLDGSPPALGEALLRPEAPHSGALPQHYGQAQIHQSSAPPHLDGALTKRRLVLIGAVLSVLCLISGVSAYLLARSFGISRSDDVQGGGQLDGSIADAGVEKGRDSSVATPAKGDADLDEQEAAAILDADVKLASQDEAIDMVFGSDDGGAVDGGAEADVEELQPGEYIELRLRVRPKKAKATIGGRERDHTKVIKIRKSRDLVRIKLTAKGYYNQTKIIRPTKDRRLPPIRLFRKQPRRRRPRTR